MSYFHSLSIYPSLSLFHITYLWYSQSCLCFLLFLLRFRYVLSNNAASAKQYLKTQLLFYSHLSHNQSTVAYTQHTHRYTHLQTYPHTNTHTRKHLLCLPLFCIYLLSGSPHSFPNISLTLHRFNPDSGDACVCVCALEGRESVDGERRVGKISDTWGVNWGMDSQQQWELDTAPPSKAILFRGNFMQ